MPQPLVDFYIVAKYQTPILNTFQDMSFFQSEFWSSDIQTESDAYEATVH